MILRRGVRPHECAPGWETRHSDLPLHAPTALTGNPPPEPDGIGFDYAHDLNLPPGSVWECDECGKVWVAVEPHRDWQTPQWLTVQWRPERRRERRRRERVAV